MNGPWVDVTTVYIKNGCNSVCLLSRKINWKGFYGQLTSFHFPIYEIYVGDFVVMDSKADPLTLFFVAMQIIFGKHWYFNILELFGSLLRLMQ